MIKWIKETLKLDSKIQEDKRANKECYTIEWSSYKMAKDLSNYDLLYRLLYQQITKNLLQNF